MSKEICKIHTGQIKNGSFLMENNGKLETWYSSLANLTDGTNMFYHCDVLTDFRTSQEQEMVNLVNGNNMFFYTKISTFTGNLGKLQFANNMFDSCWILKYFYADLGSLTNGSSMFSNCIELEYFNTIDSATVSMPSLRDGSYMFRNCYNLKTPFADDYNGYSEANLSNLENGLHMFNGCHALEKFYCLLSNLTDGSYMFYYCKSLASFNSSNLSNLTNGSYMFQNCTALSSFNSSDLSSLTNGYNMFWCCKLNTESIKGIADTINDVTELTNSSSTSGDVYKQIDIGISNSSPTTEEQGYLNTIASKGWTVLVNGSAYTPTGVASVMTLDEDGNEVETLIPYYAKPIASDEEHAEYIDADGNYFNIVGAQFIYGDDLSTYGMFTCEEDAAANMGLTKYVRTEEIK